MEIFLLLLDELDDAVATLRALWWQLWSFALAVGLFALCVWAATRWPLMAAGGVLLAVSIWAVPSLSRIKPLPRFKTDP